MGRWLRFTRYNSAAVQWVKVKFPARRNREFFGRIRQSLSTLQRPRLAPEHECPRLVAIPAIFAMILRVELAELDVEPESS
jgi:hypothetical protein